ncbi:glycosyltransferase family 1 protein [Durotheca rogersii]|uniref:glycosyltransferase family 1 protein n=1 Tax=Durotheca rogersii TaxID=419775 RepID=UPI00221ECF87|nr:glycosyltransferase family 1 protein [Durotheca rogersii]KAI5865250.1 glycosyltransferase family 1 protein [Durotheca rogersii]
MSPSVPDVDLDDPDLHRRPFVLVVSHALTGHVEPLTRVAAALRERGWAVAFLGPTAHRRAIEAAVGSGPGAFVPLRGPADLDGRAYYADPPAGPGYAARHWADRVLVDIEAQVLGPLPAQWACVRDALADLHARDPARGVLLLAEAFFYGVLPLFYGAPLPDGVPPPLGSLCVSVTVPAIRSADLPPLGYPFPPDASAEGRARNERLWRRSWERKAAPLTALLDAKLREAGAARPVGETFFSGANYTCHSTILQLGVPGFEYPRSDWPPGFKFAGLVQGGSGSKPSRVPEFPWWDEIVANSAAADPRARKKVVVVAQGTVEINPHDLIIPTMRAFADRPDVIVIAILGWKDARLSDFSSGDGDAAGTIPPNTRIADYLSYDAVLAHADVWVHNAGFGAVNHGIANGVPMVAAGEGMDKGENARRIAWSGIGIDLCSGKPTVEQVRDGVGCVLADARFTTRIRELKRESDELNCFDVVHEELIQLATMRPGIRQKSYIV